MPLHFSPPSSSGVSQRPRHNTQWSRATKYILGVGLAKPFFLIVKLVLCGDTTETRTIKVNLVMKGLSLLGLRKSTTRCRMASPQLKSHESNDI